MEKNMTPEQLEEVEKLLLPGIPLGGQEGRYAAALQKTVKALRETKAEVERLREVVRQVQALASEMLTETEWTIDRINYPIRKIHKLTKDNQ